MKRSWIEKTENLNLYKRSEKLWKLIKTLSHKESKCKPIIIEGNGKIINGKKTLKSSKCPHGNYKNINQVTEPLLGEKKYTKNFKNITNLQPWKNATQER